MACAFVLRNVAINVPVVFIETPGRKMGAARKAFRRSYDSKMTQDRFAELLSAELGYTVTRVALAKWETNQGNAVPDQAIEFAIRLMNVDDEYFSTGYNGPVLFKTPSGLILRHGTMNVAEKRHGYVTVLRGHGTEMWQKSQVSLKSAQVPRFLLNYKEYVEVPDLTLLPFISPGNVLAFSHAAMPAVGKIHLLRKKNNPDTVAIREIRLTDRGQPELYTPNEDAQAVNLDDWDVYCLLVAVSYDLAPFHGIINERGISFAELQKLA
jgi:hypothetical protein